MTLMCHHCQGTGRDPDTAPFLVDDPIPCCPICNGTGMEGEAESLFVEDPKESRRLLMEAKALYDAGRYQDAIAILDRLEPSPSVQGLWVRAESQRRRVADGDHPSS